MNLDPTTWRPVTGVESPVGKELAVTPPSPSKRERPCGHCGRICGNAEGGFGSLNGVPVCHPDGADRPNCYDLTTRGHHDIPCPECWVGQG